MCAAAIVAVVVSAALFTPGSVLDRIWELNPSAHAAFAAHARQIAVVLLATGIVAAAAGIGLLRGSRWAWLLSIALFGINGLGDLAKLVLTREWVRAGSGILIDVLLLFLLLRREVVGWFTRRV
jgi:hypothetical protein